MDSSADEKLHFFEYMKLIKEEFRNVTEKYPELRELSHREMEIFL